MRKPGGDVVTGPWRMSPKEKESGTKKAGMPSLVGIPACVIWAANYFGLALLNLVMNVLSLDEEHWRSKMVSYKK